MELSFISNKVTVFVDLEKVGDIHNELFTDGASGYSVKQLQEKHDKMDGNSLIKLFPLYPPITKTLLGEIIDYFNDYLRTRTVKRNCR